jgi:ABC-type polysaccharide/polyol phosphate export permease
MQRDLKILFLDKLTLFIIFLNFSIELFVSGLIFARMVSGFDYFLFIAPGANLMTALVVAFQAGRELFVERALRDLSAYHVTLPVPRRLYVAARIAAGVAKAVIASTPGTLVVIFLYPNLTIFTFLGVYLVLVLFSLAGVAFSIMTAVVSRRTEVFITLRSTIQLYLSFLSTVFYPLEFFPPVLVPFVLANPKTWAVQTFREIVQGNWPVQELLLLSATSLFLAIMAGIIYVRATKM